MPSANMPTDVDVYRAAWLLIIHHRGAAEAHAARNANAMLAQGNLRGVHVWRAVRRAVRDIQRTKRHPGESLN